MILLAITENSWSWCWWLLCSNQVVYEEVNLDKLQHFIRQGRLDATKPITMRDMLTSGLLTKIKHGVKILGGVRVTVTVLVVELLSASRHDWNIF